MIDSLKPTEEVEQLLLFPEPEPDHWAWQDFIKWRSVVSHNIVFQDIAPDYPLQEDDDE